DQKKTAQDYLGLSNLSGATSISDVLGGMSERQSTLSGFESTITALSKKGLSQDLIGQLEAMGPDSTLAATLAGANPAQIKQLNAMAKNGAKLSTSYGNAMADSMYDAGKAASKGFLTGLMADEKALQAAMAQIGAGAVKAIRSKKGIDAHSPSRKGAQAGKDLGAGLVAGMAASGPGIESAAARMGASAVPAGVVPVTSGASLQTASGGLNGQPLYLVVEDGVVLRAYVSDQVDDALDDVLRSKRSGKKGS
ncbi:replication protein, partial [Streptomyces sp. BF23-18]